MKIAYQSTVHDRVHELMCLVERTGATKRYVRNRVIFVFVAAVAAFILLPTDAVQGAQLALLVGGFYLVCAYVLRKARLTSSCCGRKVSLDHGEMY
jgi:Flp pilus assembly protein protease CpaA